MNKLVYVTLAGLLLCAPAFANTWGDRDDRGAYQCNADSQGERHCHHAYHHGWKREHMNQAFFVQSGQDLNSNRWTDGSPRATLPPHNARGSERPAMDPNSGYWIQ